MVEVIWRKVVPVATAESGIFLEQSLLNVEPKSPRFVVVVFRIELGKGNLSTLPLQKSTSNSVLPR